MMKVEVDIKNKQFPVKVIGIGGNPPQYFTHKAAIVLRNLLDEAVMKIPPCQECGAMTKEEAETKCICNGDKDSCHGLYIWGDD